MKFGVNLIEFDDYLLEFDDADLIKFGFLFG